MLWTQVATDLATCCLIAGLVKRLFGRRAALFAVWFAALCPFTATYAAQPLTESLVLTTIAAALYAFARWQHGGLGYNRWLWITAAALAYSILLRPEQVLFAVAVLAGMFWCLLRQRHAGRRFAEATLPVFAAAVCVVLPLVPWAIRNQRTFHVLQPLAPRYANDPGDLPPLGFARWYRTWAIEFADTENVYWNYAGTPIALADVPSRALDGGSAAGTQGMRARTTKLLADYNATGTDSTEVDPVMDARFGELAAERIHAHPVLYYFALPVARVLDMTFRPRTEMIPVPLDWWAWGKHRAQTAYASAYAALDVAYIALGLAGFLVWKGRRWRTKEASGLPRAGCRYGCRDPAARGIAADHR